MVGSAAGAGRSHAGAAIGMAITVLGVYWVNRAVRGEGDHITGIQDMDSLGTTPLNGQP